ncbi:MiaB/RimO family radical SAM methylthiotransferase [Desulfovibrio sp. OttesenSCG-928-G11]|nr:MiaB/RimO family radical SAM methylthiotransferase [Desulfovibrio sp. OttesenSCG-928-G11]
MSSRIFHIFTLGCKVNQYESQALREAWLAMGHSESRRPEEADLILINSCAVTSRAVADLRGALRRMRREAPGARIVVSGCAARILQETQACQAEAGKIPAADMLVPQTDKDQLLTLFPYAALPAKAKAAANTALFPPFSLNGYARSRAVLKIQDGCSHGCAYCFVPLARGGSRSRPFAEALAEARRLLAAGFREIIVSGVNLRQYRQDGGDFWDFLAKLDSALAPEWTGRARLRISSLEPGQTGARALDTLAECRLLAPHLHLSLQSGSPAVLERMGRGHYDPARLPDFLKALRGLWPRFGLGADLLCGFPGESEAEAQESLKLLRALPLSYAHVFPYSRRPGTRAATLPDQVPRESAKARAAAARALALEKKQVFLRSLLECPRLEVVFDKGGLSGPDQHYAECFLEDGAAAPGPEKALLPVRPLRLDAKGLLVRPLKD